jgi:hypothetical protein
MKMKLTPGRGVGEDVVPKWSTSEDRLVNRLGVEDSSCDSSVSEVLGDTSHTLWLLRYASILIRGRAHMCGAWVKICGALVDSEEEASHGYAQKRREFVA